MQDIKPQLSSLNAHLPHTAIILIGSVWFLVDYLGIEVLKSYFNVIVRSGVS